MPAMTLEELWNAPPLSKRVRDLDELPEPAQRYLRWSMDEPSGAHAVRLRMHGSIKLGKWRKFTAEQVIHRDHGMIWQARTNMGLPVSGSDRIIDGEGSMLWTILGLIPVMRASGLDISRSAAGRLAGEMMWLPTALLTEDVELTQTGPDEATASMSVQGFPHQVAFRLAADGRPLSSKFMRWGSPDGAPPRELPFGAVVEEATRFGPFVIPSRIRAGWYFETERFEAEGEFFVGQIDAAEYR